MKTYYLCITLLTHSIYSHAGEANILDVKTRCNSQRSCDFHVTVMHNDQGWDHYANKWEVLDSTGKLIALRKLLHPHDNEQPFTRSLSSIQIPPNIKQLTIRAHDSVHTYGGKEFTLQLP